MTVVKALLAVSALTVAIAPATASAAAIMNGTVGSVLTGPPSVSLGTSPSTYTARFLSTFETSGSGAFTSVAGLSGYQNGTLVFAPERGVTVNQTVTDFFVFNDGRGGTYNFSVDSVLTRNYAFTPGVTSSVGLFILGTTRDLNLGLESTPTSLTLTFNNAGGSSYSASSVLSVATVAAAVPEPATWAMMLVGLGGVGFAMRRRKVKTIISYI